MKDKEAIEYLKGQIKCLKCETGIDCEKCIMPNWSKEIEIEALEKGIEALENQKSIIGEIENIWEKIRALPDINPDYPMDKTIHINRYEVQKIIYEHITELKGE